MTFGIITLSLTIKRDVMTLDAECPVFIVMLSVVILDGVMQSAMVQ
jgi:hypothetical protein